jgi:quercetin dioxygenase-like cupin family protein
VTVVDHRPPRQSLALRQADLVYEAGHPSEPGDGVSVAEYLGAAEGSHHLSVALVELAPGAAVVGHLHPFEESFYVLEGTPSLNLGGHCFSLVVGDFGVAPVATAHAWANPSDTPARLLRVYAPQPRPMGGSGGWGVFAAPRLRGA